jgi:hypothetical protein
MFAGTHKIAFPGGCINKNQPPAGFSVPFPKPMPDLDYALQVTVVDPHGLGRWLSVRQRTTTGFNLTFERPRYVELAPANEVLAPCEVEIHWAAQPTVAAT